MRQFDIVRLKGGQLAVVLQADLLDDRETRVVAPMFPTRDIVPTPRLHPVVASGGAATLLPPRSSVRSPGETSNPC